MGTTTEVNELNITETAVRTAGLTIETGRTGKSVIVGQVIEVDPDHILDDPEIKSLREWSGSSKHELSIPQLARLIFDEGQKDPCIVWETPDGLVMVDGERRKAAVKYLRDEEGEEMMLKVICDPDIRSRDGALRAAMMSFTQKEELTPVEFAKSIRVIRKRFGYDGSRGTSQVAEFLGVSPATVTQAEKLLTLPQDIIDRVERGEMTPTAALEIGTAKAHKRADVMEEATREARKDAEKKGKRKNESTATATSVVTDTLKTSELAPPTGMNETKEDPALAKPAAAAPVTVQTKHVRAALKSVRGATDKIRAPKMAEVITLFEQWDGPGYTAVMARFAGGVVDWAHGKISDKELTARWDDVADKVPQEKTSGGGASVPAKAAVVQGKQPVKKTVTTRAVAPKAAASSKPVAKKKK